MNTTTNTTKVTVLMGSLYRVPNTDRFIMYFNTRMQGSDLTKAITYAHANLSDTNPMAIVLQGDVQYGVSKRNPTGKELETKVECRKSMPKGKGKVRTMDPNTMVTVTCATHRCNTKGTMPRGEAPMWKCDEHKA